MTTTSTETIETAIPAKLRGCTPLDKLSDENFSSLLTQTKVRAFPAKAVVLKPDSGTEALYFLVEGSVELIGQDRKVQGLAANEAGSDRALNGNIGEHNPIVRTATPCKIARVPSDLLNDLLEDDCAVTSNIEVADLDESGDCLSDRLLAQITQELMTDKLVVPSLPDIAIRIREAVADPNVTSNQVNRIVTADPAVAARLIHVANSPAYAGTNRIESCRDAIVRLGLTTTRDLVTAFAMKQLFKSENQAIEKRMREVWSHSTRVGAISFHLAKRVRGFSPDRAMLAGLTHDIGVIAILASVDGSGLVIDDLDVLNAAISELRGQIGAMVLRKWDFADDLVCVPLEAEEWERDEGEKADYADLIVIAQLLSFAGTPEFQSYPTAANLPAFAKIGFGDVSAEEAFAALGDAQAEIDEMQQMLAA